LFATLFPADCRFCQTPLTNVSRLPVCQECLRRVVPIPCVTCSVCGEGLGGGIASSPASGEPLCGLCRRAAPPFARAVAYGSYDGVLRDLIHLLKYEQMHPAGKVLGESLAVAMNAVAGSFGPGAAVVLPVPLHPAKLRQRGFNQAEVIARAALKTLASKRSFAASRLELNPRILKRQRPTQSQTGLTRHQRRENLRGAFAVVRPESVAGREILLVDDVFTTGTTVSECARILRRAGASKVFVATVARTLKMGTVAPGLESIDPAGFTTAA
jgi:ComF family protein